MNKFKDEELMILKNEIIIAEKINEDEIETQMQDAVLRYTGKHVPDIASGWDIILNEIYPIIQYELPSIFFRNPRAFLKPRNKNFVAKRKNPLTGQKEEVFLDSAKSAKTQENLLNYTIAQIRYKEEARKCLQDALLFKHAIMWHGYKGEFGMTDEQSLFIHSEQIFVKRISPSRFLFDPKVSLDRLEEARWIARSFEVSLKDLRDDPKIKLEPGLKGKPGFAQKLRRDEPFQPGRTGGLDTKSMSSKGKTLLSYTDNEFQKSSASQFITVYEVLIRPTKAEKLKGSEGHMLLITPEQKTPLREPSPWPYKAEGWPAKVLQFNPVPDQRFGMSDLDVFEDIINQKNAIINLQIRNGEANSKLLTLFDKSEMDDETVQKIEDGQQSIIGVDGDPRAKIHVATGSMAASSELYQLDTRIQANLDEKAGIPDLKKGMLRSGEESATSVRTRVAGSSARPAYRQDLMSDFLKESFLYINDLIKQFTPIKDVVRITGSLDIEWSEEFTKEEIQADVDVEIDVISMLPEDPQKELAELDRVLQMMVQSLTIPQVNQKIQQEGKTMNISPIIEQMLLRLRIRDPEVFRNLRPEESLGFASVSEMRAAQANVEAVLQNQQPPSLPQEGQDHGTRIQAYTAIQRILSLEGKVNQMLEQLIMLQTELAEEESKRQSPRAGQPVKTPAKPKVEPLGA